MMPKRVGRWALLLCVFASLAGPRVPAAENSVHCELEAPEPLCVGPMDRQVDCQSGPVSAKADQQRPGRPAQAGDGEIAAEREDRRDELIQLGHLAWGSWDWDAAEIHYRRALDLYGDDTPVDLVMATLLYRLAEVAMQRSDTAAAEPLYRRAVAIQHQLAPDSLELARSYDGLGAAARLRNDFEAAEQHLSRSLAIKEAAAVGTRTMIETLSELTTVALDVGDVAKAQARLDRARNAASPEVLDSIQGAALLDLQARLAWLNDDPDATEDLLKQAIARWRQHGPDTLSEADSVFALGWTYRQRGRVAEAAEHLCRLVDIVEAAKTRAGGAQEARWVLNDQLGDYYAQCLDVLVELGRGEQAFHVGERARARQLLALLAERDVMFARDLVPDLDREMRHLEGRFDQVQAQLWRLSKAGDEADEARLLRGQLADTTIKIERVRQELRRRSPRLAALRYPEPLDLTRTRAAIDQGTVLLSYCVTADQSYLFVVSKQGFRVTRIALGRASLEDRVNRFGQLIVGEPNARRWVIPRRLVDEAHALFSDLLGPAWPEIRASRRILFCPDGPLLDLPFGALVVDNPSGRRRPRFLAELRPLHTAPTATVYAELRRSRPRARTDAGTLVAFGDPLYPQRDGAPNTERPPMDAELGRALRNGLELRPLPYTRVEVERLGRLFPDAKVLLGSEASEENAKSLAARARYLHFACHGTLDNASPLSSGLLLTLRENPGPDQDNGFLQAWEVFESVRTDAELVTLSACASGRGRVLVGEGLIGLTRAFQCAGARSVLASLWSVSDRSTAQLMARFYGALRSGLPKDQALVSAQRQLIQGARYSHPYHWAAFQLSGDWR